MVGNNEKLALQLLDEHNIIIYDLQGRKTAELVNELKTAGYYTLKWDASDHASGIYFVKLMTSELTKTQKLVLVK